MAVRLPAAVVDALPQLLVGDDAPEGEELCAICQETFAPGDRLSVLPRCTHQLHVDCAREWLLQYSKRCPTCKASVIEEDTPADQEGARGQAAAAAAARRPPRGAWGTPL